MMWQPYENIDMYLYLNNKIPWSHRICVECLLYPNLFLVKPDNTFGDTNNYNVSYTQFSVIYKYAIWAPFLNITTNRNRISYLLAFSYVYDLWSGALGVVS